MYVYCNTRVKTRGHKNAVFRKKHKKCKSDKKCVFDDFDIFVIFRNFRKNAILPFIKAGPFFKNTKKCKKCVFDKNDDFDDFDIFVIFRKICDQKVHFTLY